MSPDEMTEGSPSCEVCLSCARKAELFRRLAWLAFFVGLLMVAASIPVDGLAGAGLAVVGIALIWRGWFLIVRRGRSAGAR